MFNWPEKIIIEQKNIILDSNELKNKLNSDSDSNFSDLD